MVMGGRDVQVHCCCAVSSCGGQLTAAACPARNLHSLRHALRIALERLGGSAAPRAV